MGADTILISDNARCQPCRRTQLTKARSCPPSAMRDRWDMGGSVSLGAPSSPPSSSRDRRSPVLSEIHPLPARHDGEPRLPAVPDCGNSDFESTSPRPYPKRRTARTDETASAPVSARSDREIRWDVGESVRLDYPTSPPSSMEKRRSAMKKLMASSRWESENRSLSVYQLISHSPPVRPTRGPNLIAAMDLVSLQQDLEAIQPTLPVSSSERPPTAKLSLPSSLRNLPYL
jgi:hypothetical protein